MTIAGAGAPVLKLTGKVAAAVLAGFVALAVFADRLRLIDPTTGQRAVLALAAALVATASTVAAAIAEYRGQRAARRAEKTLFRLRSLAFAIQDATGIDVRDLGLACYLLRRDRLLPWRRRLVRVARDRAEHRATASRIVWRPGKGVIGECVATGTVVGVDVAAWEAGLGEVDADSWRRMSSQQRMGFTYAEFGEVSGKYHTVVAAPMIEARPGAGSAAFGCVALDGPSDAYETLWTEDVRHALIGAADDLAELVV